MYEILMNFESVNVIILVFVIYFNFIPRKHFKTRADYY